ncbi:hypothetical protein WA026_017813 [Henosepilachna vigintioctopunctata]|uniref:Protein AATF n=1 Tax=Henosepilachna vigintioctopunctata TaxID=420089 RepID=A0AAW1TUT8_9CUCU
MAKSMSEKIASILNVAPSNYGEDEVDENTSAALVDYHNENFEENFERSKLRALNDNILENTNEKYAGKISSRKTLRESDNESEENSEHDFGESTEEEDNSDNEKEDDVNDSEGSIEQSESENETDFNHFSSSGHDTVSKGYCVRNQLNIWESLLETRIQLQKCLSASNKLPIAENFKELCDNGNEEFKNKLSESKSCITKILDKMLTLQDLVVKKFPETKKIFSASNQGKKSEGSEEEITSEDDNLSNLEDENEEPMVKKRRKNEEYEEIISKRHELYKTFRNSTIQKWNDKVRIGTSKNNINSQTILSQLDHIMSDKAKLIKKTQLKRSNYKIIGEVENEEEEVYNENIFDDDDFYHQLLRELIEFKSSDITDPVQLGRQWIQLQNMRNKMKRKIDTRATKGRKIRYAVHSKLVNYMAPIDYKNTWSDEAKNELFGSLFGKK